MLFNSYEFIGIFLPLLIGAFLIVRGEKGKIYLLWAASLVFYLDWRPDHAVLLLGLTGINFWFGRELKESRSKKLLIIALALNLLVLGVFKYFNFVMENVTALSGQEKWSQWVIALPLGISFFTFQKIAFLVDCYKGKVKHISFRNFILFVWFFPQLLAGPIVHYATLFPQFRRLRQIWSLNSLYIGLVIFSIGLAKKTVLADTIHLYSLPYKQLISFGGEPPLLTAWTGVLLYTFEIYFDFSGYSDMAIGLARMFGIRLPANFWSPYKAGSIIDFWRRWHMTLSAFLRTYLYIPLGGNRSGRARRYVNLMLTMLLGGLWHGAGWNFVVWGALHGLYLSLAHLWREVVGERGATSAPWRLIGWCLTFGAVAFAWAFFEAANLDEGWRSARGLIGLNGIVLSPAMVERAGDLGPWLLRAGVVSGAVVLLNPQIVMVLVISFIIALGLPNTAQILGGAHPVWRPDWSLGGGRRLRLKPRLAYAALAGAVAALGLAAIRPDSPFIYYNF